MLMLADLQFVQELPGYCLLIFFMKQLFYSRCGKRLMDILGSASLLIVLSPLLFVVIILACIFNRGAVFFVQQRPGKNGKPFKVIKLKTMRDAEDNGNPLPDEQRLTSFGKLMRKLSIDELFQLFNVLKGEMSFIGPRPLLMQYLPLYSPYERRRHEVLPGISGLAQVKGRNTLSWKKRFRYDVFYVDHVSISFDAMLCWLTVKKLWRADDINFQGDCVAKHEFRGSGK